MEARANVCGHLESVQIRSHVTESGNQLADLDRSVLIRADPESPSDMTNGEAATSAVFPKHPWIGSLARHEGTLPRQPTGEASATQQRMAFRTLNRST
jgi:hypothetical protein